MSCKSGLSLSLSLQQQQQHTTQHNQHASDVNLRPQKVSTIVKEAVEGKMSVQIMRKEQGVWSAVKTVSPGDLAGLEEFVFGSAEMGDTPVVMSVYLASKAEAGGGGTGGHELGVSFVDTTTRSLQVDTHSHGADTQRHTQTHTLAHTHTHAHTRTCTRTCSSSGV